MVKPVKCEIDKNLQPPNNHRRHPMQTKPFLIFSNFDLQTFGCQGGLQALNYNISLNFKKLSQHTSSFNSVDSMDAAQNSKDDCATISGHGDSSPRCTKPKHDAPCDVSLMVGDVGKEFKAHRNVLAEASPFFEKLFDSDMKESKERVIQLDIFSEYVLKKVLEFMYTGIVAFLAPQRAEELIVAADYLLLSNLKNFAGRFLAKTVCVSNCISYLDFAEKYHCEELVDFTKDFINANFPAVAECEEFLNLSSEEVERWISSDGINVSAEKEVYEIVCRWIKQNPEERSPKFNELFRHVRLIYMSRDYLSKEVKKKSLVKNSKHCLTSLKSAISFLDHALDLPQPQSIRKSLEKHVIVVAGLGKKNEIACYLPDTGAWYELPASPSKPNTYDVLVSRGDKLDKFTSFFNICEQYDPIRNRWVSLTMPNIPCTADEVRSVKVVGATTVTGGDIFATLVDGEGFNFVVAVKWYSVKSGQWESVALPCFSPCVAFEGKFLYSMGGASDFKETTRCFRLDIEELKNWEELAPMQTARYGAYGVAAHGKIFVLGGCTVNPTFVLTNCEVYNIETNEWHCIANFSGQLTSWPGRLYNRTCAAVLCHGTRLYIITPTATEWYNIEENTWTRILIPVSKHFNNACSIVSACSVRIPKRTLDSFRRLGVYSRPVASNEATEAVASVKRFICC